MSDLAVLAPAPLPPVKDDGAKRRQVLDGARQVILACGFDAASMNEIARVAGVSKGTLYVYFTSKEELFEALIREEKRALAEQICDFDHDNLDLAAALSRFGFRLVDRILRPDSIAHLRTVAAVSAKFPRIGQAYFEAGPEFGMRRLSAFLRSQAEKGTIAIEDFDVAAWQFGDLCKSFLLTRAIFSAGERPSEQVLKAHVARAVALFLRAYAPA